MSGSPGPSRVFKPNCWNCVLEVGPKFAIQVSGYKKISETRVGRMKLGEDQQRESIQIRITDPECQEVDKEDIITAFKFGKNIIPFDAELQKQCKYESGEKSLKILEFRKLHTVPKYLWAGEGGALVIFARENHHPDSFTALSCLVKAMKQLEIGAIARRVYSKNTRVKLGWLIPHPDEESTLLYFQLPFVQQLKPIMRKRQKALKKAPDNKKEIIGQYVDAYTNNEDFDPYSFLDPGEVYLEACCNEKLEDPDQPISDPSEEIQNILSYTPVKNEKLLENILSKLFLVFPKLQPKEEEENTKKKKNVKQLNEFEVKIEKEEQEDILTNTEKLALGLGDLEERLINLGYLSMETFIDDLVALRNEAVKDGECCKIYNSWWAKDFHNLVNEQNLDHFWEAAICCHYGPISTKECEESDVTPDQVVMLTRLEEETQLP